MLHLIGIGYGALCEQARGSREKKRKGHRRRSCWLRRSLLVNLKCDCSYSTSAIARVKGTHSHCQAQDMGIEFLARNLGSTTAAWRPVLDGATHTIA